MEVIDYVAALLLLYGGVKLQLTFYGQVRLDRQIDNLTGLQQSLQRLNIENARAIIAMGYVWSFAALAIGIGLIML